MARTRYKKKIKNGNTYYFFRFTHKNLRRPRDLYGKTVAELDAKIQKLKNEMDHNVHVSKVKFEDYLKIWLETVRCISKKKGTIGGYQSTYRNHILGSILYDIPISDLNVLDDQEYLNDLLRQGHSYNVVCSVRNPVSPCIRYAFQQ
ncbi:hypothetical protein [Eubacterium aggregans]|uniref:hypothetical protein n=1 Tax=Eubacterium aggregans TaxID=81409 RepID=UPI003F387246